MNYLESNPALVDIMRQIEETRMSDTRQEKTLCLKLRKMAAEYNSEYAACFAETYLGDYYISMNDTQNCFVQVNKALTMNKAAGYTDLLLFSYNLCGMAYSTNGEGSVAIDYYIQGLNASKKTNDYFYQSKIYNNIGDTLIRIHRYAEALPFAQESRRLFFKSKTQDRTAYVGDVIHSNLAEIYLGLGQPERALEMVDSYDALGGDYKRSSYRGNVTKTQRGIAFALMGNWEAAAEIFDAFMTGDGATITDHDLYTNTMLRIAECAITNHDRTRAQEYIACLTSEKASLDGTVSKLQFAELTIKFYAQFGSEAMLNEAYRHFYELSKELESITERERCQSILNRIKLNDAMKENAEIMQHNVQLQNISGIDELTGLPNRRLLNSYLESGARKAERNHIPIGAVVFDIDRFKDFNDMHGHLYGDKVLTIAAVSFVDEDKRFYATRFGGDEFVTICCNCSDEEISAYIERSFERLNERQRDLPDNVTRVTTSAGYFSCIPEADYTPENLIMRADQALYEAKCKKRGSYVSYKNIIVG